MRWLARRRTRIARQEWQKLNDWAEQRIANGDLDFDDCVFRTREATATLLRLWS